MIRKRKYTGYEDDMNELESFGFQKTRAATIFNYYFGLWQECFQCCSIKEEKSKIWREIK